MSSTPQAPRTPEKPRRWPLPANIAAVVAVLLLAAVGVAAWRSQVAEDRTLATRLDSTAEGEPGHQVTYVVTAAGTANEDVGVLYTTADGSGGETSLPGIAPVWQEKITTESGLPQVNLSAQGSSSDFAFTLFCTITVDGLEVAKSSGPGYCITQFDFSRLAEAKQEAAANPTPSPTPTTPRPAAPTPAACEWVDSAEMSQIVSQAAAVPKYVLSQSGGTTECHQVIDRDTSAVTYKLERKGTRGGFPATRVKGVKEPAWWMDYGGQMGELRVNLPNGKVFVVSVFFQALRADAKQIAVATWERARSDVLKK